MCIYNNNNNNNTNIYKVHSVNIKAESEAAEVTRCGRMVVEIVI